MANVKDVLGQNLKDCDPTGSTCYATIPWTTPKEWMTTADNKAFQIYKFNGGVTSNRVLASLTKQTQWTYGAGNGDAWPPVRAVGTTIYRSGESGPQADYWWYGPMKGVLSFNLDNDSGWCYTFVSAGWDNRSSLGVDHTGVACNSPNSENESLYMYARD